MTNEEFAKAITEATSQAFAHIHEQVAEWKRITEETPKTEPPLSKEEIFRQNMDKAMADHIEDKKTDRWGGKDLFEVSSKTISGSGPLGGKEV